MFVISDECLSCGTCAGACPAEAIDMGDAHYVIDQDKCLQCGTCVANCPADAIKEE
ncbi:MAG: 4Fe-4S binding protein [Eubacteriales bacterium]|nr:4Fe-4S binding protein [Eubacteriales bacterium]